MCASAQLDHIVLLLSAQDFQNVPSWLVDNFTIFDGGTHSKGTSHNKLILFEDGSYLELFSWRDPQPAQVEPHADFPGWAKKPEDHVIDWALTGNDAYAKHKEVIAGIEHLRSKGQDVGITYDEPREGGRKRVDGKQLRWVTTRPRRTEEAEPTAPSTVPFFCHDLSDRLLRVPYTQGSSEKWPSIVTHPCGAMGTAGLSINVPQPQFEQYARLYESILGVSLESSNDSDGDAAVFSISTPTAEGNAKHKCAIRLHSTTDPASIGISELRIWTSKRSETTQLSPASFGTLITLC